MIGRNDPCWCGSGKKWKKCHAPALPPQEEANRLVTDYQKQWGIVLKTDEQIAGIRRASKLAATILAELCEAAKEGVTTKELDDLANRLHEKANARPATLHYGNPPYPASICASLNEVICHGIPDDRPLQNGDIMNIDVTSILDGYYGDCSRMITVGAIGEEKQRVVDTAYNCLLEAIAICKPGVVLSAIGDVIDRIATSNNCSVVHEFVAHGTGVRFHEPPQIPHCRNGLAIPMAPGMTFTIEPMINAGAAESVIDPVDGWTARTIDGKPSAQWEHTILITSDGHEILTQK